MVSYWNCVIEARTPVPICHSPARLGDGLPNRTVVSLMSRLISWYRLHRLWPEEARNVRPSPDERKHHFSAARGFLLPLREIASHAIIDLLGSQVFRVPG